MTWTEECDKNYEDFVGRLATQLQRYDAKKWQYNIMFPEGYNNEIFIGDSTLISIIAPMPWLQIRYTTDGSEPNAESQAYTAPIVINDNVVLKSKCFLPNGNSSKTRTGEINKVEIMKAHDVSGLQKGLTIKLFTGKITELNDFSRLIPMNEGISNTVSIPDSMKGDGFALQFDGYIQIAKDDVYTFSLISDDGSQLFINDSLVVNSDGIHGGIEKYGRIALAKGMHKIHVKYFEARFGQELKLLYETKEMKQLTVPAEVLFH